MTDYTISELGPMSGWTDLYGGFTPQSERKGKHIVSADLATKFLGLSANAMEPGQSATYWHTHTRVEEVYVFLTGQGQMALDDEVVDVRAGTSVSVGLDVWRTWRCLPESTEPLTWLCIRAGGYELPGVPDDGALDRERPMPW